MNKPGIAAISAVFAFALSTGAVAQGMSKADYHAAKNSIAAESKSARAACEALSGRAQDLCLAEAHGKEKVAKADLKTRYSPGSKSMYELSLARAHADFGVAKAKCHEKADDGKKACVAEAKDVEHKAKAEAKAQRHTAMPERRAAGAASVVTSSKHEGAKEYAEDSLITTKVKAAMFEDSSLKSMEINVETYKGVVQLSGFVRSRDEINKAVELARKVKGVESVKDAMIVKGRQ